MTRMQPSDALVLGRLPVTATTPALVVTQKLLPEYPGAVTRTKRNPNRPDDGFIFQPGVPAFLCLDLDLKVDADDGPDDPMHAITVRQQNAIADAGGPIEALYRVAPEIRHVAKIIRPSTGAWIFRTDRIDPNDFLTRESGLHVYLPVLDGGDIERAVDDLFARLYLAGFGIIDVTKSGSHKPRALVDETVNAPERLQFEGKPLLGPGVRSGHGAARADRA